MLHDDWALVPLNLHVCFLSTNYFGQAAGTAIEYERWRPTTAKSATPVGAGDAVREAFS
jgi:hypothetical protein